MATTIVDVAKKAGVGEATVVRALRGSGYVSPATKARVIKAARELNYRPNHLARSLALGTSQFIGLIAGSDIVSAFHPYLGTLEQGIRNAGYSLLFCIATSDSQDAERSCLEEMISKRTGGVIVSPGTLSSSAEPYREALDSGVHLVIVDKLVDGLAAPQIIVDQYKSGRIATEHLISLGHRDIIYLAIPATSNVGRERARGFREAMEDAGIPVTDSSIVEVDRTEEAGMKAAAQLLKTDRLPTGIVTRHDVVAIGLMQTILDAGLSIPGDVSIVSHGDHGPMYALRVPLTTVHTPTEQMIDVALKMILDMVSGIPVKPEVTLLDVHLVVRASTGPPRWSLGFGECVAISHD